MKFHLLIVTLILFSFVQSQEGRARRRKHRSNQIEVEQAQKLEATPEVEFDDGRNDPNSVARKRNEADMMEIGMQGD